MALTQFFPVEASRQALKAALAAVAASAYALVGNASFAMSHSEFRAAHAPPKYAGEIVAVGHRGTTKYAPENTIAAHEAALSLGARAIEIDVRMTADGHFVVMHDASVNRTTNGRGRVSKLTLAEIRRLDAGSWFGPQFAGERVPTLREALRNLRGRAAIDIDFKGGPRNSGEHLADILDEEGFADGPLVTVFARSWHYARLRAVSPRYALRPHYVAGRSAQERARADGVRIMGLRRRAFSFAAADAIREHGFSLFTNVMGGADGPEGFADSIAAGARFIQSDRLDELVPYLRERGLLATCVPARDLSCWAPARNATVATRRDSAPAHAALAAAQ